MKKSLIALAALAAVSAASAQSSVTLYGLVDIGYGSQKSESRSGAGAVSLRSSGVMDGANAGNRIGFRGVEDLGGGLKANFVIEQGINPTGGGLFAGRAATSAQQVAYPAGIPGVGNPGLNGAIPNVNSISPSTNRQSYLGLSSASLGTVNFGYTYNNLYELSTLSGYNLGTEGIPGASTSHVFGNSYLGGTRSNGITYISPVIAGGFSVRAQVGALGANMETNNVVVGGITAPNNGKRYSLMGQYANGPLSASLAYTNARVNTLAVGNVSRTGTLTQLGASYDFGVAKLAGTYNTGRDGGIGAANFGAPAGTNTAYRSYQVGVSAPFGAFVPFITYGRASATATTPGGVSGKVIDIKQTQIGVRYSLSKRTTVYAFVGNATDNAAQDVNIPATANSVYKDKKSIVGVAHAF